MSARQQDPREAIAVVEAAGERMEALQFELASLSAQARELIRQTAEERRIQTEKLESLREEAEAWHRRAIDAEALTHAVTQRLWEQSILFEEADARERDAISRADMADMRCKRIEAILLHVSNRLADQSGG